MTRAVVIDPRMRRVLEVSLPEDKDTNNLEALQQLVGGYLEIACRLPNGDALLVNEDGIRLGDRYIFQLIGHTTWLIGQGVLLGVDEMGDNASARSTVEEIKQRVVFDTRTT